MAKKKTRSVSQLKTLALPHEMIDTKTEDLMNRSLFSARPKARWVWIAVLVAGLAGVLWLNKGIVVAAVVNGRPIFRWELNKTLVSRFGAQTLEGLISERLIADEARKSGVTVTQQDIDAKEAELMKSFAGGVKLEELLKLQGLTKEDFDNQIRLQLAVERLLSRDITLKEEDIDNYIATNRALLTATDEASLREEARTSLMSQKVSERVQGWFAELKEKAKIARFLP